MHENFIFVLNSLSEIAQNEGLTRARVTEIMNPLKLLHESFIKYLDRIIGDAWHLDDPSTLNVAQAQGK
jgi:hypothetical protein